MSTYIESQKNLLIDALSMETQCRLRPHLEIVPLEKGSVLAESGDVMKHVYFPIDSIVSLLYDTWEGNSTEISLVGNEGFVGIAVFMGGDSTPSRAVVQSAGHAYRLSSRKFKEELSRHGDLQEVMLRYTQALFTQMAQTAVCNRHHSINQQLCRFLLLMLDRQSTNHLLLTQETIANMLGVRREGITDAAGKLQKSGVIEYTRGRITVLDRDELENLTCECYSIVKQETDRLLPKPHVHRHAVYRQTA